MVRFNGRPDFIPRELFRQYLSSSEINKHIRVGKNQGYSYVCKCRQDGRPIRSVDGKHRLLDIVSRARADGLEVAPSREREIKRDIAALTAELEALRKEIATEKHLLDMSNASRSLTGATLLTEEEIVAGKMDLPIKSGVYFLIKHSSVIYVGQSINVFSRISNHMANKDFDSYAFIQAHPSVLDALESLYIHVLRPPLNGIRNGSDGKHAPIRLDVLLGKGIHPLVIKQFGSQSKGASHV